MKSLKFSIGNNRHSLHRSISSSEAENPVGEEDRPRCLQGRLSCLGRGVDLLAVGEASWRAVWEWESTTFKGQACFIRASGQAMRAKRGYQEHTSCFAFVRSESKWRRRRCLPLKVLDLKSFSQRFSMSHAHVFFFDTSEASVSTLLVPSKE